MLDEGIGVLGNQLAVALYTMNSSFVMEIIDDGCKLEPFDTTVR